MNRGLPRAFQYARYLAYPIAAVALGLGLAAPVSAATTASFLPASGTLSVSN